jgi:hypothetical protein
MSDIRVAPDVHLFLLEEEGVFFAEDRQELCVFNTPATFVWCCLEEGYEPVEMVSAYARAFAIELGEAEGHVLGALRRWDGFGYISGFAAPAGPDTDLTTALGWLLTNPRLREEFARSPADLARRLRVRTADVGTFVALDAGGLEAQAKAGTGAARHRNGRAEHALASVCRSGRSLLEVAAESRLRDISAAPIRRYYRILTTRFCVSLASAAQDAKVRPVLAHLETDALPEIDVALDVVEADGGHLLCEDLLPVGHCEALDQLVPMVKLHIRQAALNRYRYFIAIHAGVVGNGDRCILLPGAPGRGKTTLTAALGRSGFCYFSDEFALLDDQTLRVRPVPLSLTIKPGAVALLSPYYPELEHLAGHAREDGQVVRYLNPDGAGDDWARSHPVGWIIFPMYAPNAATDLRPVSRPEALRRLLRECLVLPERLDRVGVESLVGWIRTVSCQELPMGSLEQAVRLLQALDR